MDRFIIRTRKNLPIFEHVTTAICVWGPYGCGKTTWVKENFDVIVCDEPSGTIERVKPTQYVLIDDFDSVEKDFTKWFSRPRTIFVSNKPIEGLFNHEFHNKKNLRVLFGERDVFVDPKTFIHESLSTKKPSYIDSIYKCSSEHGNGMGIVHENYYKCLDLANCCQVIESLCLASEIDNVIYKGQWDNTTLFFFNSAAYSFPFYKIKGACKNIDCATLWTKYLNACMKRKKLREMRIDIDRLHLLKEYALIEQNPENLSSSELDTLKYLDFYNKLKSKTIQKLKKCQTTKKT